MDLPDCNLPDKKVAIYTALRSVPPGKVVSYGQLAKMAGLSGAFRFVGTTLSRLPSGTDLPWHRVINAQGKISFPLNSAKYAEQLHRLTLEGVEFVNGRISRKNGCWLDKKT